MAQAGSLDKTFGKVGFFTDSQGTAGEVVALQTDGKILAAGEIGFNPAVVRLNTNGTLDSSFGKTGTVVISIPGSPSGDGAQVIGIAVQSDGKILVGITDSAIDGTPQLVLERLNSNGTLDTTFGTAGVVETVAPSFGTLADVMALQPDGKILAAGSSAMARFDTTGKPDSTFGTGGISATLAVAPTAIAVQPDGKILIADGGASTAMFPEPGLGFSSPAGAVSRYNTNGALDSTFGIFGQAASVAAVSAMVVETQNGSVNNILVAGTAVTGGGGTGFGLVRFSGNGSIDTAFGGNGGVITGFTNSASGFPLGIQGSGKIDAAGGVAGFTNLASAFALGVQADGKIVAAGTTGVPFGASSFTVARYLNTGSLDSSFGSGGKVTTAFGNSIAAIYALAIQSDGKIVVVGSTQIEGGPPLGIQPGSLVVARYLSE